MSQKENPEQIYEVTVEQAGGRQQQFHGTYLAELTAKTEVKAAFCLTDKDGAPAPECVNDKEDRAHHIRFFDAVAINQHNQARLFNRFNRQVDEKHCGVFVKVDPPLAGLS